MKVAFVASHPIQYQVPVFRELAARTDVDLTVVYAQIPDSKHQGAGFGVAFEWDLPLLGGYRYHVLQNVARRPCVTAYSGCDTPGITQHLRASQYDAVVVNGWVVKTCLQTLRACKKLGIPCIVRGEANNYRPRPWWKRVLQRQLVRSYDAYLPIGKANREFYRRYGIPDEVMFDALYCIDNERFEKAAKAAAGRQASIRSRWGVPDDVLCFLYCGKFETKKHPVELLRSMMRAIRQGVRIHLLMVGDGDLRTECEAIVQSHQLPVSFAGFLNQSEIVDAYVAADVLVLPSDHGETWGLVVNEGMACGLPALVSDQVGCASDLIVEDETGWVFPSGDWRRLTDLLVKLSHKPDHVRGTASSCQASIRTYSPLAAAEGIAAAVRQVTCCGKSRR